MPTLNFTIRLFSQLFKNFIAQWNHEFQYAFLRFRAQVIPLKKDQKTLTRNTSAKEMPKNVIQYRIGTKPDLILYFTNSLFEQKKVFSWN